jgi:DNA-binding protein H-NS
MFYLLGGFCPPPLRAGRSLYSGGVPPKSVMQWEGPMDRRSDFEAMDFDQLWLLYEDLTKVLAEKIAAEKLELENRLARLKRINPIGEVGSRLALSKPRRKYPKVLPKYCNPSAPTDTWSGRGKQPRWLVAALRSGSKLDDFLIANVERSAGTKLRRRRHS